MWQAVNKAEQIFKVFFIPGCPVECGLLEWAVSVCSSKGCFPRSANLLLELLRTGEIMNLLVWSWAAQASSCLSPSDTAAFAGIIIYRVFELQTSAKMDRAKGFMGKGVVWALFP